MEINLIPKKVTWGLGLCAMFLILAYIALQLSRFLLGADQFFGYAHLIDLNAEQNIPSYYATITLLICSILLAIIAYTKKKRGEPYVIHWAIFSAIFLFLSLDESLSIHETLTTPIRRELDTFGPLYYSWIIPYSLALIIFLLAYMRFYFHLPQRTKLFFLFAGILYVSGALLLEIPAGKYDQKFGRESAYYAVLSTIEEILEMGGILVFIYSLLSYFQAEVGDLAIKINSGTNIE